MKSKIYRLCLGVIIFLCLMFITFENVGGLHAKVAFTDVSSNVSIAKAFSIEFSTGLSEGILFGDINFLPATNVNASHNYDALDNSSNLFINVSNDGNTAVDFCIRGNAGLTNDALDVIGLGNETYSYYNMSNSTHPLTTEISLSQIYVKSGEDIPLGGINYWRFWLDILAGQPSGDYNNTIFFKGIETGMSC